MRERRQAEAQIHALQVITSYVPVFRARLQWLR